MSEENDEKIHLAVKRAIPPVADCELQRDLWPRMLRRLSGFEMLVERRPAQMPWFEWALLGLLALWILFFPEAIPLLLYQL